MASVVSKVANWLKRAWAYLAFTFALFVLYTIKARATKPAPKNPAAKAAQDAAARVVDALDAQPDCAKVVEAATTEAKSEHETTHNSANPYGSV